MQYAFQQIFFCHGMPRISWELDIQNLANVLLFLRSFNAVITAHEFFHCLLWGNHMHRMMTHTHTYDKHIQRYSKPNLVLFVPLSIYIDTKSCIHIPTSLPTAHKCFVISSHLGHLESHGSAATTISLSDPSESCEIG